MNLPCFHENLAKWVFVAPAGRVCVRIKCVGEKNGEENNENSIIITIVRYAGRNGISAVVGEF